MTQRWTVEFAVADSWVADGFEMTDERALAMLHTELPHACGPELAASVLTAPLPEAILALQSGYDDVPAETSPVTCIGEIH